MILGLLLDFWSIRVLFMNLIYFFNLDIWSGVFVTYNFYFNFSRSSLDILILLSLSKFLFRISWCQCFILWGNRFVMNRGSKNCLFSLRGDITRFSLIQPFHHLTHLNFAHFGKFTHHGWSVWISLIIEINTFCRFSHG